MTDDINLTEKLIVLIETTSKLTIQVDSLKSSVEGMNSRLEQLSTLSKNDTIQDNRLTYIENDITSVKSCISSLNKRIEVLEKTEGEKAKNLIKTVGNYVIVALASAIVANIPNIIAHLGK